MAVGDRIKRVRNFRKMTMKELGMAVGFDENTADVRIAQYESNARKPKDELLKKIAAALDINWRSLYDPVDYAAEDIMFALFELDEQRTGLRLLNVIDDTDPEFPDKRVGVVFNYGILDGFLREWLLRKQELRAGKITREEYLEWKLNWPDTADECGKFTAKRNWRKEEK